MKPIYGGVTVKAGTFLYDNLISCNVRIVRTEVRYGSGDHDDPPEIRDDQPGPCFYVEWIRGEFSSGVGSFATLSEAVRYVELQAAGLRWTEET